MNIYSPIAFTLLALVAGMYLLAKTKAESLGKLFSFISYLVIIVAGLILICQLARGARMMACRAGVCPPSENCMPEMMGKPGCMHGGGMNSECREMEECGGRGHGEHMNGCSEMNHKGDCCKGGEEAKGGCMHDGDKEGDRAMKMDSAKAK